MAVPLHLTVYGKTKKQRRQLRKASMVAKGDYKRIRQQLARMK